MASQLDREIRLIAQREREVLAELLPKIQKMDITQEFLDLDFQSLFAYLTKGVGYSEGSAQRRIDAARLMRHIPNLAEKLESGANNLGQVGMMKRAATVVGKKRKVTADEQQTLFKQIEGKNGHESQIAVAKFFDIPVQKATSKKPQADGSVRLELTVSKELYANIQKALELLLHSVRTNEIVDYLEYLTNKVIAQKTTATVAVDPAKQAMAATPLKQAEVAAPLKQAEVAAPLKQAAAVKSPTQTRAVKSPDQSSEPESQPTSLSGNQTDFFARSHAALAAEPTTHEWYEPRKKPTPPKIPLAQPAPKIPPARPGPKTITPRIHREVRAAEPCCQHRNSKTGTDLRQPVAASDRS